MTQYDGKVVIISGGSRGLGLSLATSLLERGAKVASFARSATAATDALGRSYPTSFLFKPLDATDEAALGEFVGAAHRQLGPIHGLVNNAAIGQDHLLANMPPDLVGRLLDVNLRGPILLTRLVVRLMLVEGSGRIVTITSICATRGFPGLSVYSATKGAMEAFTRSLARELGGRGITVNAIAPGFFASEMSASLATEQLDTIRRRTPIERLLEEHEVLPVLDLLLLGPSPITGQVVNVDGGYSI